MDLLERALYFCIGGFFGSILGYVVARLKVIDEKVEEVDDIVKTKLSPDDRGFMRYPFVADVMLLLVVLVTVWAAFASQKASNDVQDTQERMNYVTDCNQKFLAKLLVAVNERTTFTGQQARANIELQRAQAKFLGVLLADPPKGEQIRIQAANEYFNSLTAYVDVNGKAARSVEENPYPTIEEFGQCLEQAPKE
jgi:hypothetical protein